MRTIVILALCSCVDAGLKVKSEKEFPNLFAQLTDQKTTQRSGLKAFYVNLDKSKERASCISQQLAEQRIGNNRYVASTMPNCGDFDFKCFQLAMETNKDCFKSGADLIHMFQHGSKGNASSVQVAGAVLANWCSHKRLFQELASNTSSNYGLAEFAPKVEGSIGNAVKKGLHLHQKFEEAGADMGGGTDEEVYIIMEDDAILKPNFGNKIEEFVRNYAGKWDMVQVDTFGSKRDQDKIGMFKDTDIYHPSATGDYFGLHCILVKKSAVGKLNFEMGLMPAVPVDWFPKLLKDVPDTNGIVWNPDIVINPEVKAHWSDNAGEDFLPKYCDKKIVASVIGGEA